MSLPDLNHQLCCVSPEDRPAGGRADVDGQVQDGQHVSLHSQTRALTSGLVCVGGGADAWTRGAFAGAAKSALRASRADKSSTMT